MSAQMIPNVTKVLVNAATVTVTGNSPSFTLPMADSYAIFLNVTAASGTTPTLDVVLQTSPDGGTTWLNLPLRFAQFTAVAQGYLRFQPTLGLGEAASGGTVAATGGVLALNTPFIGGQNTTALNTAQSIPTMRFLYTVSGTTPSLTLSAFAIMAGRGNTTSN